MSLTTFYASSRWGSRWGIVDASHPTPHKGLDIRGISRQAVPALRSGTIIADQPSSSVGRYITVRVRVGSRYEYDTYCHVVSLGRTGTITQGQTLTVLAGWDDKHGTAWTGPHLHLARSTTITGWAYWGAANLNPEPVVIGVLTSTAGGGTTPIEETEVTIHILKTPNGQNYRQGEFSCFAITPEQAAAESAGGGRTVLVTDAQLALIAAGANQANDKLIAEIIAKMPPASSGGESAETIAATTRTALAPDFAAIPAAVIVEQKKPGN